MRYKKRCKGCNEFFVASHAGRKYCDKCSNKKSKSL